MKIWIRSQAKDALVLTGNIHFCQPDYDVYAIIADNGEESTFLGAYESKARVLEVIDMIQNSLIVYGNNMKVFDMPEK